MSYAPPLRVRSRAARVGARVVETERSLKLAVRGRGCLVPLLAVLAVSNPSGSGCTVYIDLVLAHGDGSETTVDSFSVAEGSTESRSYTADAVARAFRDGVSVVEVRVYAYCSATPAPGYEPGIALEVYGVQL